ncbi:hypothetical protein [Zymobacter sp. IVIA_5232.4 C2]|uniref:hypothetical protein n=1 Tax=Zymobacter sp. IVIA_5232.4 C2 TaxID=3394855 RepID=UPI0039C22E44
MIRWLSRIARWIIALTLVSAGIAVADPIASLGEWQKLTSRYPVLPDASDTAISMALHSNFTLNTAEPSLVVDVSRHPLPLCSVDTETGLDMTLLGDGTLNGRVQTFGYRCMGGQMTIMAWPIQQSATYWKEQIMAQQPLSLSVAGIDFQSANTNGKRAMSVANRIFME